MKKILTKLCEHENLTRQESRDIMTHIAQGKFPDSQLAAFMTVYLMRSITLDEVMGFRDAILDRRVKVDLDCPQAIDIVGTGGDGKNTFNISTATCFVVAATGHPVVKHGNYGSTSVSGASNVLEHHGVKFTSDTSKLRRSLDSCGMAYLHAPLFSPALKSVGPVRKQLGVRTFFNILGPLVNPTMPQNQLLGVFNLKMLRLYNYIAQALGVNCTVVHSLDGYDEISLTSPFKAVSSSSERVYTPTELGFATARQNDLFGGDTIAQASEIFDNVLSGKATEGQTNAVVANAAFAINTVDPMVTVTDAIDMAREAIASGRAMEGFKKFVDLNS